jgi:hypothetical protein
VVIVVAVAFNALPSSSTPPSAVGTDVRFLHQARA